MKTATWNRVLDAVHVLPSSSAEELAWQSELSVSTVRRYLAEMVARKLVAVRDELRESEIRYGRTRLVHVSLYSPRNE